MSQTVYSSQTQCPDCLPVLPVLTVVNGNSRQAAMDAAEQLREYLAHLSGNTHYTVSCITAACQKFQINVCNTF